MNMNKENNRQELARRLVDREVYYCVSSLVSTLSDMAQHDSRPYREQDIHWEEDILPLLESVDYEEAGTQHINDCDDLDDLEKMADEVGYWSDALENAGYSTDTFDTEIETIEARINEINEIETNSEFDLSDDLDNERDNLAERLEAITDNPVQTWLNDCEPSRLERVRASIIEMVTDWSEFCSENDIDTDDFRNEVYEHWLISNWLARKLSEKGYLTGELCGLTIWGRCCTGQAIALDRVIQEIACELWPEEVLK